MNIEFVARNTDLDDQTRSFAEEKLHKLYKFLEAPVEIRVTLEEVRHRSIADLHVAHRFGVLQATEETDAMLDSIHLAIDKLEKQARRARKKFLDRRRKADRQNGRHHWPVEVLAKESLVPGSAHRVIKASVIPIKPMAVEEAALTLDKSKHDFVVFRNSTTDRVNVLYKRRDDNYGLIAPEF